jgi:predicted CopG family antitoxin
MQLRTIAVSTANYQVLKNLGRAGDSFNDVITHLIQKVRPVESSLENNEKLQPYNSHGKQSKAVATPRETVSRRQSLRRYIQ